LCVKIKLTVDLPKIFESERDKLLKTHGQVEQEMWN
jgi:hypothetical protein